MRKTLSLFLLSFAVLLCGCSTVRINDGGKGTARFIYRESNIEQEMASEDVAVLIAIFSEKTLHSDLPACSFSENVAVVIDGQTFCFACDGCNIIHHKEDDKYFFISEEEDEQLKEILSKYGFHFPCI